MFKVMRHLWFLFKYFVLFGFLKDFKAGQDEAIVARNARKCSQMHCAFYDQMRRVVDEEDEFGLVD